MKILVTGATGFVGGRFAQAALDQGFDVRISGRRTAAAEHLVSLGARFVPGDLTDPELARRLCMGIEAVVHCAGTAAGWGRREHFHSGNVQVTENIVEACLREHVRRLVHLSSPAICFDGRSRLGVKEEATPRRFYNHYAASKFMAEQKVFGAAEFGLEVLALRPRGVVGAGDGSWLPQLLQSQHKQGLAIVGNGLNKADFTSVQNLNKALFRALGAPDAALGRAYNISNGTPLPFWDVINYAMRQVQLPQVRRYRSFALAYCVGALNEGACLAWPGRPRPARSRLEARIMNTNFTLDITRARRYLDYTPDVSVWTALDEFCNWWKSRQAAD